MGLGTWDLPYETWDLRYGTWDTEEFFVLDCWAENQLTNIEIFQELRTSKFWSYVIQQGAEILTVCAIDAFPI